ncbi:MAG TPA: hypothetical protein VJK07_02305 [Candidatus Nanoarchaeia archaeon]|nr:hypothetical protein [Candidatus Nanoarchaeia archaeon]
MNGIDIAFHQEYRPVRLVEEGFDERSRRTAQVIDHAGFLDTGCNYMVCVFDADGNRVGSRTTTCSFEEVYQLAWFTPECHTVFVRAMQAMPVRDGGRK